MLISTDHHHDGIVHILFVCILRSIREDEPKMLHRWKIKTSLVCDTPLPRQTMSIRRVRAGPLSFKTFLSTIHVYYIDLHGHRSHSENMVVFIAPLPQYTVGGGWVRGHDSVVKLPKTRSGSFNDLWNLTPRHSFSFGHDVFFPLLTLSTAGVAL